MQAQMQVCVWVCVGARVCVRIWLLHNMLKAQQLA